MSPNGSADVDARIRSLIQALEAKAQRLADARSSLKRTESAWRREAEQAMAAAAAGADKALRRSRKGIEANADEARIKALRVATNAAEEKARGYLGASWSSAIWQTLTDTGSGEWVRVGDLLLGSSAVPITLPLSVGVWSIGAHDTGTFVAFVQNVITRVLAAFDAPSLRVLAFDPDLTLNLGVFSGVRSVAPASVPPAITSAETFERALDELVVELASVDDRLTAAAQATFWSALAAGHPLAKTIPFRLLVVGAPDARLTDRGRERMSQIRKIAADRGLLVVELPPAARSAGAPLGTRIDLTGSAATVSTIPGVSWTPEPWAGDRFIRTLCAGLADRPRQSRAPTVSLADIVGRIKDPWLSDADDGLEATIGLADVRDLTVHLRSENPPMPNALVGGAVGQGKSNLLLVLIHSLAVKYSPAELQMVLVDLRDGVEFARLGPSPKSRTWLPHVRAMGIEFDPDYSIAVLRWVLKQMTDRSRLLKSAGATKLREYREMTGKVLPRLLVVVDEFQRLFEGTDDQADEAATLLEQIARTGRGFGVHLMLASQAITGIRGLAARHGAIFGQFHNRITLANTAEESQAFLSAHNLAATDLEYRGQVVVNDSLGAVDHNRIGTVAYADGTYLVRLQAQLFAQGHGAPPTVFRATSFAAWPDDITITKSPSALTAAVGLPIAVETAPRSITLSRSPNQGLAVAGADRWIAIPILTRAVATAVRDLGRGARVTLLDGDSATATSQPWVTALIDHLTQHGAIVERTERSRIPDTVTDLAQRRGTTDLVVAVALDSVDLTTPAGPDYVMPNDALRELLKTGPISGMWTIGWWQSMPVLEEHLGYRAPGVRAWAFCGVSRDDLTAICGHAVREPTASPRFVWFDRNGAGAERLVPFAAADILGEADLAS